MDRTTRTFHAICPLCHHEMGNGRDTCVYDGCPTEIRMLTPFQLRLRQTPLADLVPVPLASARSSPEYRALVVRNRAVAAERAERAGIVLR